VVRLESIQIPKAKPQVQKVLYGRTASISIACPCHSCVCLHSCWGLVLWIVSNTIISTLGNISYRVPPPTPPAFPGPDGALGAGPLGGFGFGLSGPLTGFFSGALRPLGLLGFFGVLGLSGLLLPGRFGPLGLFGGLLGLLGSLGVGLPGCCEPCMPTALKPYAPMPGGATNAPIEINATDHRTLRKFIVISLDFTIEIDAILKCSQQHRHLSCIWSRWCWIQWNVVAMPFAG
jgi:hypothetical protein